MYYFEYRISKKHRSPIQRQRTAVRVHLFRTKHAYQLGLQLFPNSITVLAQNEQQTVSDDPALPEVGSRALRAGDETQCAFGRVCGRRSSFKDTISTWKQHTTPDHFSHDAANRPDINWKMNWQNHQISMQDTITNITKMGKRHDKSKEKLNNILGFLCLWGTKLEQSGIHAVIRQCQSWASVPQDATLIYFHLKFTLALYVVSLQQLWDTDFQGL